MLQAHPEAELSDVQLAGLHSLYHSYAVQRIGPSLLDCDFAFYPCCNDAHWFLFILDIKQQKLLLIDPLAEWGDSLKSIYSRYIYAMECIVPTMLHYLDPSRFDGHKLKVHFVQERPMQSNTHDCGVYVCKYMDVILNGISLRDAVWEPVLGTWTFRYRIAWELSKGLARRISDYGI
ncbi:putative ubiquitin-like-specific protease 1B [Apium graveolens]|uniref:putative ubiquitin-like-specific protease 1B n=1 Tax=Apium graveolens TaxID=4045 RepID=UPI003D7B67EC